MKKLVERDSLVDSAGDSIHNSWISNANGSSSNLSGLGLFLVELSKVVFIDTV